MTDGATLFTGPAEDATRYSVPRGDLDRPAGGGEGLVYRAHRTATGEVVALKLLTGTSVTEYPQFAARAATLTGVRHPNLMGQIETFLGCPLGHGTTNDPADFDVPYSVAQWVDGQPLTKAAVDASIDQKLRWLADLSAALDHLHKYRSDDAPDGLVHRDIKPSNIQISNEGSAVLLDFGVARPVDGTDMTEGVGTYLWRAPEVLSSGSATVGKSADVWGLGAVAHWLVVGEPPPLDGAEAARERLESALERTGRGSASIIAHNISLLLHSRPASRPNDIAGWSRRLTRRARPSLRKAVLAVPLLVSLAAAVGFLLAPSSTSNSPSGLTPTTQQAQLPPRKLDCEGESDGHVSIDPPINSPSVNPVVVNLTEPSAWIKCRAAVTTELGEALSPGRDVRIEALTAGPTGTVTLRRMLSGETLTGQATVKWKTGEMASGLVAVRLLPEKQTLEGSITLSIAKGPFSGYHGAASFTVQTKDTDHDPITGYISGRQILLTNLILSRD